MFLPSKNCICPSSLEAQTACLLFWLGLRSDQSLNAGRLIVDLLNEPDGFNMTWSSPNINTNGQFANSTTVPSWGELYTNTSAALIAQEPALLFLVEGTGQRNQPGTAYGELASSNRHCFVLHLGLLLLIICRLKMQDIMLKLLSVILKSWHQQGRSTQMEHTNWVLNGARLMVVT